MEPEDKVTVGLLGVFFLAYFGFAMAAVWVIAHFVRKFW